MLYQTNIPYWTPSNYRVSGAETLQQKDRRSDGCLYVRGFEVQKVRKTSDRLLRGTISREALSLCGFDAEMIDENHNVPDEIWRTFVADRDRDGNNAPLWYRRAFHACLMNRDPTGDLHIDSFATSMKSLAMQDYISRLRAVLWDRKVVGLEPRSGCVSFGLAPPGTEADDVICILLGCSVPVVLRKVGTEQNTHYRFIGEAFIYDMMNGEALKEYKNDTDAEIAEKAKEFRLR
jgi:hypothetical protein